MADDRAKLARFHHRRAEAATGKASDHRIERDRLILALRADDPGRWTYAALAEAVGCSPELIAAIVKGRTRGTLRRER